MILTAFLYWACGVICGMWVAVKALAWTLATTKSARQYMRKCLDRCEESSHD